MHPGKSHVLGRVLTALRRVHRASRGAVAVVAPTGVAAANIGAVTLHSWTGIAARSNCCLAGCCSLGACASSGRAWLEAPRWRGCATAGA